MESVAASSQRESSVTGRPGAPRVVVMGLNYAPEHAGIGPYTTATARGLAEAGMQVTALTGRPHYPEWRVQPGFEKRQPPQIQDGVRVHRVRHPVPNPPATVSRIVMESVFALRAGLRLLRRRADVVLVVSPALMAVVPALLLRPFKRYRLGVVVQDIYGAAVAEAGFGGGRLARLIDRLETALLRRADGVVVIHEVFRHRLAASGVPADRLTVIPNWTHIHMPDHLDRAAARAELGWGPDEVIALHSGNMGVKQGLEGLVDVARLAGQRGSRVRVVLLGEGSRRPALVRYGQGVPRLTFLDPLPDGRFEAALAAADVLMLNEKPGVLEMSVPSKLTSYFAAGRPVVACTDPRSGAAALVEASGGGVIVRSGDAPEVLETIEKLAGDPERAEQMGQAGQEYAATELSGPRSLARYAEWVEALAARR